MVTLPSLSPQMAYCTAFFADFPGLALSTSETQPTKLRCK